VSAAPALDVLFVDNHVLAVAKPAGVACVPDASGDESLYDRARAWVRVTYDKPGEAWLGVVHRLDRPVSGVVCFARTSKAAGRLSAQIAARTVTKRYLGVCSAELAHAPGASGELVQWLVKDAERNTVRAVGEGTTGAREARTLWRVVEHARGTTLLELEPVTGRSHQLRLAARALGAPLVGDLRYGAREPLSDASVALHARAFSFDHPTRAERIELVAALPGLPCWDFAALRG
jgi:23S rRNA pseudouridine1911/1915/1917 synthase